ncbi:MAG: LysE family translocator, partial [SAR324 cluster bacterium]|nr:LysE family translocator [SAR324 cluster bacterium]
MNLTQWSQLALICIMGAMSPGPSLAVVLRNTVSGGRT